jgi:long-chain acyl-CoA synthetase
MTPSSTYYRRTMPLGSPSVIYMPLTGTTSLLWQPNQPLMLARDNLLQTIAAEGVTLLPGVPFLFDLLTGAAASADLSKVRMAFSGAVALRKPTFDTFLERFGIPIRQALGTTETSVVSFNTTTTWCDRTGRTGRGQQQGRVVPAEESLDLEIGESIVTRRDQGLPEQPPANRLVP